MTPIVHRGTDYIRTERGGGDYCVCDYCRPLKPDRIDPRGCLYVNPEKVFADLWEAENNESRDILQTLVWPAYARPNGVFKAGRHFCDGQLSFFKSPTITPRDAAVAATAIQWLGTSCGWAWLRSATEGAGWTLIQTTTMISLQAEASRWRNSQPARVQDRIAAAHSADRAQRAIATAARLAARLKAAELRAGAAELRLKELAGMEPVAMARFEGMK